MNVKMTITLPLTIALFVCGVYCPRNELPSWFPLRKCKFDLDDGFTNVSSCIYEFSCSEDDRTSCTLIERFSIRRNEHSFKKTNVEFISIDNEKMRLSLYMRPNENVKRDLTCEFLAPIQAGQFHKLITRHRRSELVRFVKANYVNASDNKMSVEMATLYLDGFESNITIVVKNDRDEAVLIIPKDAISEITLRDSTIIDLSIHSRQVLYEFGFSTPSQALAWNRLLNKLSQPLPIQATPVQAYRRPHRDPAVDTFLREIQREIPR